ncbi:NAD(P)-dependent alcohol dehydrogenase [Haladaptatus sp. AB618]|uniref:NAD(P)-dependent alcohol dehydrogenase n=1 Tax=Haladaptatus sp. AB618 TaxID=2934173 RepID=UPI00209BD827|nr:NAD(P)-dependent alcohol dehydrogenase [Haladaptatus sp. AB618]MCO8252976.1 NAD(P)-dependent alcohol dehydrogenase [Haladaptatus sp. AB618]
MKERQVKAAVVTEQSDGFHIEELSIDEPRAGEVLVRIVATGVCPADIAVRDGGFGTSVPAVPGHEGAGVVEAVGDDVTSITPGDHVVLSYDTDGTCRNCAEGNPAYCSAFARYNFDGVRGSDGSSPLRRNGENVGLFFGQSSFSTHSIANERQIVRVPDDVPLELLGPLGCGIQTGCGAVMNSLDPNAGTSIAIFGVGAVGLSAVMGAVVSGCTTVVAVDLLEERLELANRLGATHTIDAGSTDDLSGEIRSITDGGVDNTLDTTSVPSVVRAAVDATRVPGTCGLLGGAPTEPDPNLDMGRILSGRAIRGISQGDSIPQVFIPRLIDLYRQGRFPFDELVEFYDFEDVNRAAEDLEAGRTIKPVLRIGEV